ncbi:FAD-binding and (Fe-S)-binding domain-containing protein [Desulfosporosinus meridiei]|uniref:D-lactate dehydrogenase (cytochrome) n=1 Tax=Desulfosporosinus meridiei (strain ATCC BAA-275 / DSM 13257 / KCTC 12902 / NCIMB 13706 / S10) TaxID=768704 RepID=J7J1I9_DESMD|nr:FAD-binding and (Fe-S)-binding domain-containing protein [Desulfosporosinus meridiei]AFQ44801.1 FAD/FMN-dependent dehydrogenase [Desulfosporosinus meridiei DSM 13257]
MTHRRSGTRQILYPLNPKDPRNLSYKQEDLGSLPKAYQEFYREITRFIPYQRVFIDPLYTLGFGIDASFYRLIPKVVVKVLNNDEMSAILKIAQNLKTPVTFRCAGTSLSGQALTDSVLLMVQGAWRHYDVLEEGKKITLEPGILGVEANRYLRSYGRKIGPDPASIDHCMIGGIAANNASGMCCGTADNSYKTVEDMRIIFDDGTILDTADPNSRKAFLQSKPELILQIESIRDELKADPELTMMIEKKYKIKNTTGYSLNAFVDFEDPIEIIKHVMIGSEGTLGFISQITYKTVIEHEHKASALIIYPDMDHACRAVMKLNRDLVSAAEMMDRASLKTMEEEPGMPNYLRTLSETATALLVEVRAENREVLEKRIGEVKERLKVITTVLPIDFTTIKSEYETYWKIRKGIFPAVGGVREQGTAVIIEDVAFPLERLAEATLDLRNILNKFGYVDAIIYGHALDGNWHFIFTPKFETDEEINRYAGLMNEVNELVVKKYDGSLKAEHGTGRNMAPFVELEWGSKAYQLMKRIKSAFDPQGLLNPGVVINDNQNVYLEDLKMMPESHETIDRCTNCGFCQDICPSKNITTTPRMRIILQREISFLKRTGKEPQRLMRLLKDYDYAGNATCATDGLCAKSCPLSINTGDNSKYLRSQAITPTARFIAQRLSKNMNGVTTFMRFGLGAVDVAHSLLGTGLMDTLATKAHTLTKNRIPNWNPWMPGRGSNPKMPAGNTARGMKSSGTASMNPDLLKVVYFPSCISRSMGPASKDRDQRPLHEVMSSLLDKAGYEIIYPPNMDNLCCGMPWESKGFFDIADEKSEELEKVLLKASENGKYPILCDTSPCLYRMKRAFKSGIELHDSVEFTHDFLLNRLKLRKLPETVAVHVTCSSVKMHLSDKFKAIAEACAEKVVMPDDVHCCGFAGDKGFSYPELNRSALAGLKPSIPEGCTSGYSNSRTCEIGLSLHSGISYQSLMYLVDRSSTPLPLH